MKRGFVFGMLLLVTLSSAWAQDGSEAKIYEIKWRNAHAIARLLEGFLVVGNLSVSETFNTITITTTKQRHAAITELLKKYDTPPKKVELQFYLIKASSTGEGIKNGLPERIRAVIEEIAALTRYQRFELLDTPILQATEGKTAYVSGKGTYFYSLGLDDPVAIVKTDDGKHQIRIGGFGVFFTLPKPSEREVGVKTSFQIGDGETVVVGASQIQSGQQTQGPAIITVVTANIR